MSEPIHGRAAWAGRWVLPAVLVLLAGAYVWHYLTDPALPGGNPAMPLGWFGWFDQSATRRSVAALAGGNLDPSQHHYPLGHPLLGVPGYLLSPQHPFFGLGLVSLLGAALGFVAVARRLGLAAPLSGPLFAAAVLSDPELFRQWCIPWNTTPVAALLWALIALAAAWMDGRRRPVWTGLTVGVIVACRPTEGLIAAIPLAAALWADMGRWQRGWRQGGGVAKRAWVRGLLRGPAWDWARVGLAAALVVAPVVGLHLAIYGPHPGLYLISSAQIGFTVHDLGWKAYVILLNPYSWFFDGYGLLQHRGWYALGVAGLLLAPFGGKVRAMLAATLVAHVGLYVSYVDLLPTGLFRFHNVHYVVWAVPGLALMAALLVRDLVRGPRPVRGTALGAVLVAAVVLCLRLDPKEQAGAGAAKAVDFDAAMPPFLQTYFGEWALEDEMGVLRNNVEMRVFVVPGGIRVVGLKRDIVGVARWAPGRAPPGFQDAVPSRRLGIALRLGWPPSWWRARLENRIPVPEA